MGLCLLVLLDQRQMTPPSCNVNFSNSETKTLIGYQKKKGGQAWEWTAEGGGRVTAPGAGKKSVYV